MWWFLRDLRNPISTGLEEWRPGAIGEPASHWRGRDRLHFTWRESEARPMPAHWWSPFATPIGPGRLVLARPTTTQDSLPFIGDKGASAKWHQRD